MPDSTLVSVVIPSYQRRKMLRRAVQSVFAQEDVRTEIIICDDGSTDGTQEDWKHDQRVRFLALPHRGACAARNAGIRAAHGEFIAFLDSDDCWLPRKLSIQLAHLESSHADAVCCAFSRIFPDGTTENVPGAAQSPGVIAYEQLLLGNFVSTQTILGRTDFIRQHHFTEDLPRLQDWDYALQLCRSGQLRYFDDTLVQVYATKDSISSKPALGLQAVDQLWSLHHDAYLSSLPAAQAWQRHVYYYAVQLGQTGASLYRKSFAEGSFSHRLKLRFYGTGLILRAIVRNAVHQFRQH